ncbi:MAG: NADPH-dependent glutamate synthase [Deltaproteobacteria bacterium]|nr:NADPH-dependent glutamate synthase [Deltaproteobacteria bacterium]
MYRIVHRAQFSEQTFLWDVYAPDVARAAQPGQFVMLRLNDSGERIPLTIADFDREWGTVTMVIQAVGKTTQEMMRGFKQGDEFADFVGPLGLPSHVGQPGHVVVVGGGLGVAPIFPQLRAFKEAGNRTTGIIGFRNKSLVFWEDRFARYCDELIVCTDDGSYGRPGFVTAALDEVLGRAEKANLVVAIGPLPMMQACAEVSRPHGVKTMVSLNAIMVDGTGMCGSCRVTVSNKVQFACVDGPDFDGHQVDFKELMLRQQRFRSQEGDARAHFERICNVEEQLFELEKRNYKKLKDLPPHATKMPERPADERSRNFLEVNLGYGMADALTEAQRCIQCVNPTCIAGCPVAIDIPRFIRHLLVQDLGGALEVIQESNLFPSICGRVCPQEMQCEAQCILTKKMESVSIGRLERFVGDHAPRSGLRVTGTEKLGRVAIVGSGPAGLACAGDLAREGAEVTVFEALHVVGGVLRYGIPSFRLPREIIDREVKALEQLGVRIETNKVIGRTFTIQQLMGEMGYDAVFIGTGAGFPSFLGIPGEFAGQVYSANEFLTRVNLMGGDRFPYEDTPVAMGKRVVVLGAGNTAMDCLRVARRLGAEEVHCIYRRTEAEAPARAEELRHAHEEGIRFHWLRAPLEIQTNEKGNVSALVCQQMELGPPDASGRRRPVAVEGEKELFPCDTVIYALGTRANPIIGQATPGLQTRDGGYIVADGTLQATSMPGVFAGGDIVTGGATVILALGAGRRAARAVGAYLRDRSVWPPVLREEKAVEGELAVEAQGEQRCPKCHGPVEGSEEYVCCAELELAWACGSCHKVYEGFAFPYGLCPSCGGPLVAGTASEATDEETTRAVRQALEIELGGIAFYEQGAASAASPELAELFRRLSEMEKEHLATLVRRYHVALPNAAAPGLTPPQVAVYAGVEGAVDDALSLLRLAVELEKRARRFFLEAGRRFDHGSQAWRLYRELEAEERDHVDLLSTALVRLRAGKPLVV